MPKPTIAAGAAAWPVPSDLLLVAAAAEPDALALADAGWRSKPAHSTPEAPQRNTTAAANCSQLRPAAANCQNAYPVVPEQLCWGWGDWLERCSSPYAVSVLEAADPATCRLSLRALMQLLAEHGFTTAELQADAHPLLPLEHAGQALAWLGY